MSETNCAHGVGLILLHDDGCFPVIRELSSKPHLKESGDLSIPLETVKFGESELDAVIRLMDEELGLMPEQCDRIALSQFKEYTHGFPTLTIDTTIYFGWWDVETTHVPTRYSPRDGDIAFAGLMSLDALFEQKTRFEVNKLLRSDYVLIKQKIINITESTQRFGYAYA